MGKKEICPTTDVPINPFRHLFKIKKRMNRNLHLRHFGKDNVDINAMNSDKNLSRVKRNKNKLLEKQAGKGYAKGSADR